MTFLQYLSKQKKRDGPIGDLARDVCRDKSKAKPRGLSNIAMWTAYLHDRHACIEAFEALKEAWEDYMHPRIEGA